MKQRDKIIFFLGMILVSGLLSAALTAGIFLMQERREKYNLIGEFAEEVARIQPESEPVLAAAWKEYAMSLETGKEDTALVSTDRKEDTAPSAAAETDNLLARWGWREQDIPVPGFAAGMKAAGIGFILGGGLLAAGIWFGACRERRYILLLTEYLEKAGKGEREILSSAGESAFGLLQDAIDKTVTALYREKENALLERQRFADNLSDIAHQLKTPLTAISLSVQMLPEAACKEQPRQIRKQLARLTRLEESLLVLSRIDAGVLELKMEETDAYTLLVTAADQLQMLFREAGVGLDLPELGEVSLYVDCEWTMEAVMNLFKNCMEHTPPGGTVHCAYAKNPLYTEIRIWDEGDGFAGEDLPHLFERFYRGRDAAVGGTGIGLALARELTERQNGTLRAENLPEGGACFTMHFYCH